MFSRLEENYFLIKTEERNLFKIYILIKEILTITEEV